MLFAKVPQSLRFDAAIGVKEIRDTRVVAVSVDFYGDGTPVFFVALF